MGSGSSSNKSQSDRHPGSKPVADLNNKDGAEQGTEDTSKPQSSRAENGSPAAPSTNRNVPGNEQTIISLPSNDSSKNDDNETKNNKKSKKDLKEEERIEEQRRQQEEEERQKQEYAHFDKQRKIKLWRKSMRQCMGQMENNASKEMTTTTIHQLDAALEDFQKKYMVNASNKSMVPRVKTSRSLQDELEKNVKEKNRLMLRLSEVAGARLVHNNPVIADLSDPNRATKLAERASELYDNQWTDLFDDASRVYQQTKHNVTDKDIIICLRDIFHFCYGRCQELADTQRRELHHTLSMSESHTSSPADGLSLRIKEWQKKVSGFTLPHLNKTIKEDIRQDKRSALIVSVCKGRIWSAYIEACIEVSWYAQIQNPPVVIRFDHADTSDTSLYRVYTKSGPLIDYIIWPILFLYEGGPVLAKGTAQFKDAKTQTNGVSVSDVNADGQPVYKTKEEEYKFKKNS